eukprot:gnl/Hemi2/26253_TR8818_c0_g1_i1.p2 gnl/Hemi2/26253_TR8818_c0_g1~~gnl/Hemi2/26253_TR8818_c0_g1_i1.p2  ORF type:complete len:103 (-),score=40.34 gnl/Hemi2/26253_TR8818_c0_g1_i1:85-393(-)
MSDKYCGLWKKHTTTPDGGRRMEKLIISRDTAFKYEEYGHDGSHHYNSGCAEGSWTSNATHITLTGQFEVAHPTARHPNGDWTLEIPFADFGDSDGHWQADD